MAEARGFSKSYEAIEAACKLDACELEVLMSFDDRAFDIHIPLDTMPMIKARRDAAVDDRGLRKSA